MGVNRNILNLAVPSILANITVPIVGMADIAVAGHLDSADLVSSATLIGGVAIGTMLFDLLYWNFGFLRVGTGGLTAQAYGRGDMTESARILGRAASIALLCSAILIAVQWLFVKTAFLVVDCSPEVRSLASEYFFVRIWASPATLTLMAFKGWFIGMQDSISPMITDLTVNIVNIAASIVLALGLSVGDFDYQGIGFTGIAAGTVIAQYSGLLCALIIMAVKYRAGVFSSFGVREFISSFKGTEMKRFFVMNTDLFIRSLCFIGIYIGFTTFSAHYGDLLLASSTILMKIMMLFSYFTDGFAYAGEALAGRYIGAGDRDTLIRVVRSTFIWSMGIGVAFMFVYAVAGQPVLRVMTSDYSVIDMSLRYMPWMVLMPVVGCAAFAWDGIYIGATASKPIRNTMILAAAGFFLSYFIGLGVLKLIKPEEDGTSSVLAVHILLAAYFVHLAIRTVYLSLRYRKHILTLPFKSQTAAI